MALQLEATGSEKKRQMSTETEIISGKSHQIREELKIHSITNQTASKLKPEVGSEEGFLFSLWDTSFSKSLPSEFFK